MGDSRWRGSAIRGRPYQIPFENRGVGVLMIRAVICFCSVLLILRALPVEAKRVTLEAAVKYALTHSESIRMAEQAARAAKREADRGVAFTAPQFTISGAYTEMGDNAPDPPASFLQAPDRDLSAEIQGRQVLYAGGRIGTSRTLRDRRYRLANLNEATEIRDIRQRVRNAFDAVLHQRAAVEILTDRVRQRETELADARDLREVGMVTSLDVRQARLSLNMARDALSEGEAGHGEALIAFNLAIGRSGAESPWVPEGDLREIPPVDNLVARLREDAADADQIEIRGAETRSRSARLEADLAGGDRLPSLYLVASGGSAGESPDEMDESWRVGLQASWDLMDGGAARSAEAAARARMRRVEHAANQTRKAVAGEMAAVRVNIESLAQRIRLQREAVALAAENYKDARGHYRAGTITLTRLGEFSLATAEARFNLIRLYYLMRGRITQAQAVLTVAPTTEEK